MIISLFYHKVNLNKSIKGNYVRLKISIVMSYLKLFNDLSNADLSQNSFEVFKRRRIGVQNQLHHYLCIALSKKLQHKDEMIKATKYYFREMHFCKNIASTWA